ncbi:MAG TPA: PRC-barrel domain-containing protein [Burkholderiales bacterium]|nr:PRC-barrel domain-containing protein [Burkholderiales bacterium]
MLLSARRLQGERVRAMDGDAGRIDDVYFDDASWSVRYMVVRDDRRIPEKEHLVPSRAVAPPAAGRRLAFTLRRDEIEHCPGIESDPPVSYQFDVGRVAYYGDETFLTWGVRASSNPHLRASSIVIGYNVHAKDGGFGHVTDLVLDSERWAVKALVVTAGWLPGKSWLVDTAAVEGIDWAERCIHLRMTRAQIRNAQSSLVGALE